MGGRPSILVPFSRTLPRVGRSSPTMSFRSVLFRPRWTDDGDDLAVVDPERHAVEGRETAEALCDRVNLEEQIRPPRLRRWTIWSQRLRLGQHLGHQSPPVFNPRSGAAPWSGLRTALAPIISPHCVHLNGHRVPGDVERVGTDVGGDPLRIGSDLLIASATIFTYA